MVFAIQTVGSGPFRRRKGSDPGINPGISVGAQATRAAMRTARTPATTASAALVHAGSPARLRAPQWPAAARWHQSSPAGAGQGPASDRTHSATACGRRAAGAANRPGAATSPRIVLCRWCCRRSAARHRRVRRRPAAVPARRTVTAVRRPTPVPVSTTVLRYRAARERGRRTLCSTTHRGDPRDRPVPSASCP